MTEIRKFDGNLLKKLRNKAKLSQSNLALKLNMRADQNHIISSWETGRVQPALDDMQKLAEFFNKSVDSLYYTMKLKSTAKPSKPKKVTAPVDQTPVKPVDKPVEELISEDEEFETALESDTPETTESREQEPESVPVDAYAVDGFDFNTDSIEWVTEQESNQNVQESIRRVANKLLAVENQNLVSHFDVFEYVDTFLDGTFAVKNSNTGQFYRVSIKEL